MKRRGFFGAALATIAAPALPVVSASARRAPLAINAIHSGAITAEKIAPPGIERMRIDAAGNMAIGTTGA
jgi:hypothetical protein